MTDAERLELLKLDVMISPSTTAYDDMLSQLLASAAEMIGREGITLDPSRAEDNRLIIGYAAFLFRQRTDEGSKKTDGGVSRAMPRWLRWALNNRLFSKNAGDSDA